MRRFRQITLNVIYFCNILLLFLLGFEEKVELPLFLQVAGRMHPLILHFPLSLLFIGIFLEWLVSRKDFHHPAARKITRAIFYFFALGAAFTALFGFFLYTEGSYQGEEMLLHKWSGTAISFLALLIIWIRERSSILYYATLGLSAVCLTVAGHLGAEITHGKGFLTEPVRKQSLARIEVEHVDSAVVFRDVIQPILNEKCLNCHNANKAKNDLILSDYESLFEGGKNGEAIVAGKAEESLIFKYAMLPMDDSLHMPPKGKLQLDPEEVKLIGWWINTGASANEKYVNLPKPDSVHPAMLARFLPKTGLDLVDIAFADHEKINGLNNPYRTVQQIAATKPYVAVFLGSKKDFSERDLTELKEVGNQIVSLDLGNSRTRDRDLETLDQFPHLQKLHLQNTDIGDEGLRALRELRYLQTLNLSGTRITAKALDEISRWKNLKKLYLYNTRIPDESVQALNKAHPELEVYSTRFDLTDTVYHAKLTVPLCKIDSAFFHTNANVEVKLSRGKVKYYYTLDGSEPSAKSTLYEGPLKVDRSCELKVIAAMDGWTDSDVAVFPLLRLGAKPRRVFLETKPDAKYSGKLDSTLVDGKAATPDMKDKDYLGFSRDVQILFEMEGPKKLSHVTISFLKDVEKDILPPQYLEVWGGSDKSDLVKLAEMEAKPPAGVMPACKGVITVPFPEQSVTYIRLKAKRFRTVPTANQAKKNSKASVFIDEIALQ